MGMVRPSQFTTHAANQLRDCCTTLTAGAYAAAINGGRFWFRTAIASGGFILAGVFQRLDVRTRELVKVSEPALAEIERRLQNLALLPQLDFVSQVEKPKARW